MKNSRKLAAFVASILAVACMAAPMAVSAASLQDGQTGNTITINADSKEMTHGDMAAYQVFAGVYNATASNLTVTGWGDGINVDNFIAAIKADTTIGLYFNFEITNDAVGAQKVADVIATWTAKNPRINTFAKLAVANKSDISSGNFTVADEVNQAKISDLPDGYYVIADKEAATDTDPVGSAFTLGLLQVAGGTGLSVTPKIDYPTVVKKVKEDDQTNNGGGYGAGFNDVADWDVNTDVPFKIIAKMPSNIDKYDHYYMKFTDTLDDNFGTPTGIVVKVNDTTLTESQYTVSGLDTSNDMTIEIMDLKGLDIAITDATEVTVTYNAKLNNSGDTKAVIGLDGQQNKVKLEYSNNPNVTGDGTSKPGDTGETPEDKVIVFTYEIDITKIDGATKAKIPGAEFKLANAETNAKWAKVNADGYFEEWVNDEAEATVLTSDDNGIFKVIGLDDGTYYLHELNWSTAYNIPSTAFTVEIDATTKFTQDDYTAASDVLTGLTGSVNGINDTNANVTDGIVSGTIENNKGSKLPTTGGIGTTIFYVAGGALVVGAGVLLVSKKRMSNK